MLMGGNSHGEGNITMCGEFNFHADPEAAKVVIDRMQCPICIVPWETCKSTNISWASLTNLFLFDIQPLSIFNMKLFSAHKYYIFRTGENIYWGISIVHK